MQLRFDLSLSPESVLSCFRTKWPMSDPISVFSPGLPEDYRSPYADDDTQIELTLLQIRERGRSCSQKLSIVSWELGHGSPRAWQGGLGCVWYVWDGEGVVLGICGCGRCPSRPSPLSSWCCKYTSPLTLSIPGLRHDEPRFTVS